LTVRVSDIHSYRSSQSFPRSRLRLSSAYRRVALRPTSRPRRVRLPLGPTPDDLVPGDVEGLHDRLRLAHGKQRVEAAAAGVLTVLDDGLRDDGSDGGFSSVYGHGVKPFVSHMTHNWDMEILITTRLPAP
jgi:hypothetical protein